MNDSQSFHGSLEKVGRAKELLEAFGDEVENYFSDPTLSPVAIEGVREEGSGDFLLVGSVLNPPPLRFGVMMGEIIHNLRSSLDHLVWGLPVAEGHVRHEKAQYPICDNRKDFKSHSRLIKWLREDHQKIIEGLQPFSDPLPYRHPLSTLRDLSNQDKHQVVHQIFGYLAGPVELTVNFADPSIAAPYRFVGAKRGLAIQDGAILGRLIFEKTGAPTPAGMELILDDDDFKFGLAFGDDPIATGGQVIEVVQYVEGIIETFVADAAANRTVTVFTKATSHEENT